MGRCTMLLLVIVGLLGSTGAAAQAPELLQPFALAELQADTSLNAAIFTTKASLKAGGFEVIGEVGVGSDGHVLAITRDALMKSASRNRYGGYGAVVRVALTQVGSDVQVSYSDPRYFSAAYRLASDNKPAYGALKSSLGARAGFGARPGLSAESLRNYQYTAATAHFSDQLKLGSFESHDQAVAAVEAGLAAHRGGTHQVYRLDLPGTEKVLFGVALTEGKGADTAILAVCSTKEAKRTAYVPYEIFVSGDKVFAMSPTFRIPVNFPDLDLATFVGISKAPAAIEASLRAVTRAVE